MSAHTPLYETHRGLGARLVDFAGWEMPVAYGDPAAEHRAVRTTCGLFDVSHMGEIRLRGVGAGGLCQWLTTNDVRRLRDGGAQYTVACRDDGGIIDDLILYRLGTEDYLAIVNAAHSARMYAWCLAHGRPGVLVADESSAWGLLAIQGPRAHEVVENVLGVGDAQRPFSITAATWGGVEVLVSRTGYTGEDGFEVLVPVSRTEGLWSDLLERVLSVGGSPAGLAARDTLRLEAALPLCGSDMDESTTPLQVGLGWVAPLVSGNDFIGRTAIEQEQLLGPRRRLVCVEMVDAGVPRHGYPVCVSGVPIGAVTSGARSPTLGRFIAMALVEASYSTPGTIVDVIIRGRPVSGRIVPRPFYRRPSRSA